MSDFTRLLDAAGSGDRQAAAHLLPLVYDELRQLAAARMAGERPDHTLDPTALVHEAFLRLTGQQSFESRSHFLRAAAEAMRRILVDHARGRAAEKRGGPEPARPPRRGPPLDRIAGSDARPGRGPRPVRRRGAAQGRTGGAAVLRRDDHAEAARTLGVSVPTAERWWAFARTWLYAELDGEKFGNPCWVRRAVYANWDDRTRTPNRSRP